MTYHQIGMFFPSVEMGLDQQLNCIMRFAIYFTIVLLIIRGNINSLFIVIITAFITVLVYESKMRNSLSKHDLFDTLNIVDKGKSQHEYKPTRDNPFMNIMVTDYNKFPNRPPAGSWTDPRVKDDVHSNFDAGLMRGDDDVFNKQASDRQYYTMPSTTIPNNQGDFARWLYHVPAKTYKEDGIILDQFKR